MTYFEWLLAMQQAQAQMAEVHQLVVAFRDGLRREGFSKTQSNQITTRFFAGEYSEAQVKQLLAQGSPTVAP